MEWSEDCLSARVASFSARQRYAAGSPDAAELAVYRQCFAKVECPRRAVCLGMTPELRRVLISLFDETISVDCSSAAIQMYAEWLDAEARVRERICASDWLAFLRGLPESSIDCVAGDGILCNFSGKDEAYELLLAVRRILRPTGVFVMRSPVMPARPLTWRELRDAYRTARIDEASFGVGSRLLGHSRKCFDSQSGILDNAQVFAECERLHAEGELLTAELKLIQRYLFRGRNWIPGEACWSEFLSSLPFESRVHPLEGRHWYQYYRIHEMLPL